MFQSIMTCSVLPKLPRSLTDGSVNKEGGWTNSEELAQAFVLSFVNGRNTHTVTDLSY